MVLVVVMMSFSGECESEGDMYTPRVLKRTLELPLDLFRRLHEDPNSLCASFSSPPSFFLSCSFAVDPVTFL